jgi:hypothetical protein
MHEAANIYTSGWGSKTKTVNAWEAVRKCLQGTSDHIVWVVTNEQKANFLKMIQKYDLEKYLVVDQRGDEEGTTNRNYPDMGRRLRTFIMKGEK